MADYRPSLYAVPGDRTGLLVTESIMLLSILGGVGSLPFMQESGFSWYWIVALAAGALTILTGIWYAVRSRGRSAPAGEPRPRLVLPGFAVLTGILVMLPALASWWLQRQAVENAYLFEIYFCTPAFVVWIAGAGYYAFPILNIKPKHLPQVAGLLKSGLNVFSALLLWVYMGLSVGLTEADWMFWSAFVLAVVGGGLGIPAAGEAPAGQRLPAGQPLGGQPVSALADKQPAPAPGGQA